MTSEVHTYIKHKNCLSFRLHQNLGLFSHLKWYVKHTLATGPVVHCGRCFCEREVCACLCSATDKITETMNICLTVLRNNKKAVKRRFQLKQVPKFSSASELKNFIVTEKSSVSFCTKIQILIFNPKTDISFFFLQKSKNDHWSKWSTTYQRRWIHWIISKTRYFGRVSSLRIRKEWILPAVTRKNFYKYISFLTRLLIFPAIFEPELIN